MFTLTKYAEKTKAGAALRELIGNFWRFCRCRAGAFVFASKTRMPVFKPSDYKRKSDTLFILGTGPSINDITQNQWQYIGFCDSIGMNLFLFSDFIPDLYMFEIPDDRSALTAWTKLAPKYFGNMPRLILTSHLNMARVFSQPDKLEGLANIFFNNLASKLRVYNIQLTNHRNKNAFWFSRFLNSHFGRNMLLHVRGSVSVAIDIGIKCGFTTIVLCGVDLDNKGYFYDVHPHDGSMHLTAQPLSGTVTLRDYIVHCRRSFSNINFALCNPLSQLKDTLPVYAWPSKQYDTQNLK